MRLIMQDFEKYLNYRSIFLLTNSLKRSLVQIDFLMNGFMLWMVFHEINMQNAKLSITEQFKITSSGENRMPNSLRVQI